MYYYYAKWGKDGTLEKINSGLNKMERKQHGKQKNESIKF